MSALLMPTRFELDLLAARLALANGAFEALEHLGAQELLQRGFVAFRERHDDHLVGGLGAVEELARIEARIGAHQLGERAGERAVLWRVAAEPRLDILDRRPRGFRHRRRPAARQRHHGLVGLRRLRPLLIRRRVRIKGLALIARAPAKHIAQADENYDRQHQKQQSINIEGFTHPYRHPR